MSLPTEAWEYAARGSMEQQVFFGGMNLCQLRALTSGKARS